MFSKLPGSFPFPKTTHAMSDLLKKTKSRKSRAENFPPMLESLEARIAPASLDGVTWKAVSFDTPTLLQAGQGLSTTANGTGAYLLQVTSGQALVFATDLNGNGSFDMNEITGISAGNGLKMTSFVDINGDIVTNLNANGTLTDLDPLLAGNDGRVLLNSSIQGVTLRSLTANDSADYLTHLAYTTYSIHGNIYSGGSFGVSGGGLIIDTAGWSDVSSKYGGSTGQYYAGSALYPTVGNIMTGTATTGEWFSFGLNPNSASAIHGQLSKFTPAAGINGGDIIGVKVGNGASLPVTSGISGTGSYTPGTFQIGGLHTGDGGSGARGGNITDVTLNGDIGGFFAITGNGGSGDTGGAGGAITNLVDLGSSNALVQIHTGDGGVGLNGKGGAGGTLSLGQFSTTGNVQIVLGDGGDGILGGGAGAGLGSGSFTPTEVTTIPTPLKIVTTYRAAGDIGSLYYDSGTTTYTSNQIDFNGDSIGDMVYISENPNQLVVKLGVYDSGAGTYGITSDSPTYYLAAPEYSSSVSAALVVGDFNGDGHLDIATASSAAYSTDSLYVYLGTGDSDTPFAQPMRSAIPFWNMGADSSVSYLASGGAITDMAIGDFNNDGKMDIAFSGQYRTSTLSTGLVTGLVVMTGLGDGYFYADTQFNSKTSTWTHVPITTLASGTGGHPDVLLQSTALVRGNLASEALIATTSGGKTLSSFQVTADKLVLKSGFTGKYMTRTYNDTLKQVEFGPAETAAVVVDFTVMDVKGTGTADVLTLNDSSVLVAFKGNGTGGFAQQDQNHGIMLTGEFGVLGADSTKYDGSYVGMVSGDYNSGSDTGDFAIYSIGSGGDTGTGIRAQYFTIDGFAQTYDPETKVPNPVVTDEGGVTFGKPDPIDNAVVAFASYAGQLSPTPILPGPHSADYHPTGQQVDLSGMAIGTPNSAKAGYAALQINGTAASNITGDYFYYVRAADNGIDLHAGNGGNSQLGVGGAGGSIGAGKLSLAQDGTLTSSINLSIPKGTTDGGYIGTFTFTAGSGGDGFTTGGAGGNVTGIGARYVGAGTSLKSSVELIAGDGGVAIQGTGGKGGDVGMLSIETLTKASAGDGGDGMTGGYGGAIYGNGNASLYDARVSDIELYSGQGGDGIKSGGYGGNISGFKATFLSIIGGVGGSITYEAGDGGAAVSGRGGNGGSILSMSPLQNSLVAGNIYLTAGDGGDGLAGGTGGSITTFVNNPDPQVSPAAISVIAGNGGTGVSLAGGAGGSITGVTLGGSGQDPSNLLFNRFLAGQGGGSYGNAGGAGGSIYSINVSSTNTSVAIAAGAGGFGLTSGGLGGSVYSSIASAAGGESKILVIAGEGGDAYAFLATAITANPTLQGTLKSYGGVNGVGGNGGSISTFTSSGESSHTDIIAGNGGNLINYGAGLTTAAAGKGGSVYNVKLAGDAGDVRTGEAILAYTSLGTPMASFVTNWLAADNGVLLTNAQGNVGVVVGAAGRVSVSANPTTQGSAALNGVNGSVSTFSAKNIMSMVAGSVDRISAILSISGLTVPSGGVLGAYKTSPVAHTNTPYYYDASGAVTATASLGGKLMDGAILAITKQAGLSGPRVF